MKFRPSKNKIFSGLLIALVVLVFLAVPADAAQAYYGYGYMSIAVKAVEWDRTVTITGYGFPEDVDFIVRMDVYGNTAYGGIAVEEFNSGDGGTFEATYDIPYSLRGVYAIAIRVESSEGYYAWTWFYNRSTTAYNTFPEISIVGVDTGETVTVKTFKFPEDIDFKVRMASYGSAAWDGIIVDKINSGDGDSFTATFDIPPSLKYNYAIAIRFESVEGYYAYNWFYNRTTADYSFEPEFSITSVVKNDTVTVKAFDFPENDTFVVRMGVYGTAAEYGVVVAETNTGDDGEFSATYNIPPALYHHDRIAIRMDNDDGYYSVNWFYNTTAD